MRALRHLLEAHHDCDHSSAKLLWILGGKTVPSSHASHVRNTRRSVMETEIHSMLLLHNKRTRCGELQLFRRFVIFLSESHLAPFSRLAAFWHRREVCLHSPHEIGSYFGGLFSSVQVGITPSTQLKFRPSSSFSRRLWQIHSTITYQRKMALKSVL